jgi:hypothetical protein
MITQEFQALGFVFLKIPSSLLQKLVTIAMIFCSSNEDPKSYYFVKPW